MHADFFAQPYTTQLGKELSNAFASQPPPTAVTIVSAFVAHQALRRLRAQINSLARSGTVLTFVVGVDLGGTSREALQELQSWPATVFVYKNRRSHVTFHPKVYLVEWPDRAVLFVGSNNLTDGGMYTNYEGTSRIAFDRPRDQAQLDAAKKALTRFLTPGGPTVRRLDVSYLAELLASPAIPSEAAARRRRARIGHHLAHTGASQPFGIEPLPGAPPLSPDVVSAVLTAARAASAQPKGNRKGTRGAPAAAPRSGLAGLRAAAGVQLNPAAFYMELVTTGNHTRVAVEGKKTKSGIPGEQRIPLEALMVAQSFWNWPYAYARDVNPRKGVHPGDAGPKRVYHNFRSRWRVAEDGVPAHDVTKEVRLYLYENSSDFRFYSREIAVWGSAGDIVRITPSDTTGVTYECVLAKAGTTRHTDWRAHCQQASAHTKRAFGFT